MGFNTRLLDEAIARRRERNEAERQETLAKVLDWLAENGQQFGIQQAYLFGSLTRPHRFHPQSDVDLAVESMEPEPFFMAIATLSEYLEREVDIVELKKCHFAQRIRDEGILWSQDCSSSSEPK